MKIYTKTGDDGTTGLQDNSRVAKSDLRIKAYGEIDETNSVLGVILSHDLDSDVKNLLVQIQNELFIAGSDLSNPDLIIQKNRVTEPMILNLEKHIDLFESEIDPLTNFILPGGIQIASFFHLARTVSRRAEISVVELALKEHVNPKCQIYLNRLSDLLFVMARLVNKRAKTPDVIWKP